MKTKDLMVYSCVILFCGCNVPRPHESKDENDSLTNAFDVIDTNKAVCNATDTMDMDSTHVDDECSPTNWWYHLTKIMYEVEFPNNKLKQDIIESIDSIDNIYPDFAKEHYIELNIYDTHVTVYSITDWDGLFCGTASATTEIRDRMLGYYTIGEHIAIVNKNPFAVNTNEKPKTMHFKWYITPKDFFDGPDATLVLVNMLDDMEFILPINSDNYFEHTDSLSEE